MLKKIFARLSSVVILFFIVSFASAQSNKVPNTDPDWTKPYAPFRIAGDLYYVGTYDLACYLIVTSEGNMLINTGLEESVSMIHANIEKLGFKYSDTKILLTTQAHFDHVAGMAQIKNETGARMMVQEGDAQVLTDGGKSDFLFGGSSTFPPVLPDHILHDGDTITLGKTKVVALHHPGHTKGSSSFMVDVKDEDRSWRVLIVNIPSILPQTHVTGMATYPNVGKDYANTFESLFKLQFDLWVASHASQFRLHDKRKPGDGYEPKVFSDRPGYEASINTIKREYNKRLKEEGK
jgi:metallo-beta-lactamase class B